MTTFKYVLETTDPAPSLVVETGGSGIPGGSSGQIQYNNSGVFGGFTNTQLTNCIEDFTSSLSGAVPSSGGGTANYLRADGTWHAPSGSASLFYNIVDYGAVGNNSTDCSTAIQNALNAAHASGGTVYVPAGTYLCNTGLSLSGGSGIKIVGDGRDTSIILTASDITLLSIDGGRGYIADLLLYGIGANGSNGITASNTSHTLKLGSNCVDMVIERVRIAGGYYGLKIEGNDITCVDVSAERSYGSALVCNSGGAQWFRRCKFDNQWPVSYPTAANNKGNRANSTAYAVNDFVLSGGYYLQCSTAGTSGGSAPTLVNYNTNITDGTVTWKIACKSDLRALELTSAATETHIEQCDFTGAQYNAIYNSSNITVITDSAMSQSISGTIECVAGKTLIMKGNEIFSPLLTNSAALSLRTSWNGETIISDNIFRGLSGITVTGIYLSTGITTAITGNSFSTFTNGVMADSGVDDFIINSNVMSSVTTAIWVTSAGSDYFIVTDNLVHGATITNSSTGTHKNVSNNI